MIKSMFVLTCNKCLKEKLFYGLTKEIGIFLHFWPRYTEDKMITRINEKSFLFSKQNMYCADSTENVTG